MLRILLAVDGSDSAIRATRALIKNAVLYKEMPQVELLTVRPPLPPLGGLSGVVVSREMVDKYHREEGERALLPSQQLLREAGIAFASQILVGEIAQTIVEHAKGCGCEVICMGTRGTTGISNLILGSVSTKVLHLTQVPVMLVP